MADPPYKILTEFCASADTFVPSHSLISACVSYAISGVAVLPVPIAQTGSYAITIFDQSSTCSLIALSYLSFTSLVLPDSLSSSDSPMHAKTENPCSTALFVLRATSSSVSPKRLLLSE